MYEFLLTIHSWLRWIVVLLLLFVIIRSFTQLQTGKYEKIDNILGGSMVGFFHLQLLLGLVLYIFLSPATLASFQDFGAAMKNPNLRFWAVEHSLMMILAVVVAQVGRIKIKKATLDKKQKLTLIYGIITLVFVASRIPWTDIERLY